MDVSELPSCTKHQLPPVLICVIVDVPSSSPLSSCVWMRGWNTPAEWQQDQWNLELPKTLCSGIRQRGLKAFHHHAQTKRMCAYCLGRHHDSTYNTHLDESCKKAMPDIGVAPRWISLKVWAWFRLQLTRYQAAAPLFTSLTLVS